jgi:Flp pilus assembly protein TadG
MPYHGRRNQPSRRRRADGQKSKGQSLVELALLAPVLLLMVLGTIDFGRSFFAFVSVTNAARNGADYASTDVASAADLVGIRSAAVADTNDLLDTSATNPLVIATTGVDSHGDLYSDVTVTYTFSTLFPWPGLASTFDIERTVRARINE